MIGFIDENPYTVYALFGLLAVIVSMIIRRVIK